MVQKCRVPHTAHTCEVCPHFAPDLNRIGCESHLYRQEGETVLVIWKGRKGRKTRRNIRDKN